ncbi:hypothetical protein GY14_02690 [Delftia tsuruhatensis]|uniref:DUF2514 family protein n=1 Tax=Delftia tsuruhatensis TaxID=180282 RepID=A0ABN4SQP4_9BURK|nr:hypothetical protein [Delftia tsuruhatensis]AOV05876.1 hypothetical protein BI380_10035 [Delftia tsuruhatensis]KEH10806.1 hypothetical protein GY14_02690 [Delftia tsuruhatensis]
MIPALYTHLAAAGAALAIGASGAWWAQGQRYGLQIEQLQHQQTSAELKTTRQAVTDMAGFQKGLTDALANFQATGQRNQAAQQDLDRSLRELRTATAGMRGDFAGLPERIAGATQASAAQYATTCTALLERLADRGERMAERGSEITRKADGHAADAALMRDAWPKVAR